jgi:hypothetical protein
MIVRRDLSTADLASNTIGFIELLERLDVPWAGDDAQAARMEALNSVRVYVEALVAPDAEFPA